MPTLSTTYTPAGIRTETSGVPSFSTSGGGGNGSLQALAEEMMRLKLEAARRRAADELAARAEVANAPLRARMGTPGASRAAPWRGGGAGGDRPATDPQRQMQQLALLDMQQMTEARGRGPRVIGDGSVFRGMVDTNRMNWYEKEALNRQGASQLIDSAPGTNKLGEGLTSLAEDEARSAGFSPGKRARA